MAHSLGHLLGKLCSTVADVLVINFTVRWRLLPEYVNTVSNCFSAHLQASMSTLLQRLLRSATALPQACLAGLPKWAAESCVAAVA